MTTGDKIGIASLIIAAAACLGVWLAVRQVQRLIPTIPGDTPAPMLSGAGAERVIGGAPMVYVPYGDFLMGSSDADKQAHSDEKPQHTVYLDAFWIDKFEVTNAQYKKCVDAGNCSAPRLSYTGNSRYDNYPVIYISWNDAKAYCEWAGKRLPTEAEWEKAARGTDGRIYPWGNTFDKNLLNSAEGGKVDTTAVGSYPGGGSPYGVMDMAGNVWEWVADWYDENYYAYSPLSNPTGPSSRHDHVLRGGSWSSDQIYARSASRYRFDPDGWNFNMGFRCARSFS